MHITAKTFYFRQELLDHFSHLQESLVISLFTERERAEEGSEKRLVPAPGRYSGVHECQPPSDSPRIRPPLPLHRARPRWLKYSHPAFTCARVSTDLPASACSVSRQAKHLQVSIKLSSFIAYSRQMRPRSRHSAHGHP